MTIHTLSNGVSIEQSTRKDNRSGYTGATLSLAWTLDANKPFIANCGNPTDEAVKAVVTAKFATSLHLGHYADAREAAYVIGMYRADPINTILYVQANGAWVDFPEELYDLPEGLSSEAIKGIREAAKAAKSSTPRIKKVVIPMMDNRPAKDFIAAKYGFPVIKDLIAKYGRTTVQSAHDNLTVNEYELRFGM